MKRLAVVAVMLVSIVAACDKRDQPDAEASKAVAPVELSDEALDQAQIPVKEDFEPEARAAINEDSLESQLDALEKDIESDSE
jgi:hypothetical protein